MIITVSTVLCEKAEHDTYFLGYERRHNASYLRAKAGTVHAHPVGGCRVWSQE